MKDTGVSIGMFSRYGKVTTTIHSIFHEKKERSQPKQTLENELYKRFLNHENQTTKENLNKTEGNLEGSYFFRYVSREKAGPKRAKTPDLGRYRPKHELTEPKVVYYPAPKEKTTRSRSNDINAPNCVKHGSVCEYKARQLSKKIDVMRTEINTSGADVDLLYKNHLINKTAYNMFRSPSIKLIKRNGDDKNDQENQEDNSNNIDIFDPAFQKSQGVVAQMTAYNNLKEELKRLTQHNQDVLEKGRSTIPEKLRPKTPTPVPLYYQIARPPLIKPSSPGESQVDISAVTEENNLNKTFGQNPFRNTCNFAHYSRRKSLFNNKDASLVFYEYDKFKVSNVDRNKTTALFHKTAKKPTRETTVGSMAEYSDLMKSFHQVAKKTGFSFDMKRTTKRKLSFPKESFLSTQQNTPISRAPNTFYSVSRTPDVSFINQITNKSFL